jgi:hypothetical protein
LYASKLLGFFSINLRAAAILCSAGDNAGWVDWFWAGAVIALNARSKRTIVFMEFLCSSSL